MKKSYAFNSIGLLLTLFSSFVTVQAQANQAQDIQIEDAWIGAPPPSVQAIGGFMLLKNPTNHPITLVKVQAKGFDMVMLHQTINKNGMHKMTHLSKLTIPAQGEVRLQHGSYHIMYMGIHRSVKPGDSVKTELKFKDGSVKTLPITIEKRMK